MYVFAKSLLLLKLYFILLGLPSVLCSKPPKGTSLRGTTSFDVFCVKVSVGASAVGERTPCRIYTKFCTTGDIRDVITPANFGFNRFRGFSVASSQILGFSIGFRRRPYNTLALPCECVTRCWINRVGYQDFLLNLGRHSNERALVGPNLGRHEPECLIGCAAYGC